MYSYEQRCAIAISLLEKDFHKVLRQMGAKKEFDLSGWTCAADEPAFVPDARARFPHTDPDSVRGSAVYSYRGDATHVEMIDNLKQHVSDATCAYLNFEGLDNTWCSKEGCLHDPDVLVA